MSTFHYQDKTANLISAITFMPIMSDHAPFYVDDNGVYGIRWTLNYEVMFYIFISVALLFTKRWLWSGVFFAISLIILPILLGYSLILEPEGYKTSHPLLGLITNPIIWLFIVGMMLGLLLPYLKWVSPKVMACATFFIIISAAYFFSHGLFTGHGILSSGWIYALILISVVLSEDVIGKYVPSVLLWLGNISFSLYLIHTLMNNGIGSRFSIIGLEDGYGRFYFHWLSLSHYPGYRGFILNIHFHMQKKDGNLRDTLP
jgi:peptidoglycan/LPS O-acetylase OafA/YrhL